MPTFAGGMPKWPRPVTTHWGQEDRIGKNTKTGKLVVHTHIITPTKKSHYMTRDFDRNTHYRERCAGQRGPRAVRVVNGVNEAQHEAEIKNLKNQIALYLRKEGRPAKKIADEMSWLAGVACFMPVLPMVAQPVSHGFLGWMK